MREVGRTLGLSDKQVRTLADKGELPCVNRDGVRRFPKLLILARATKADADEGARQALAVSLLREGRSDVEIVEAMKLPIALVREMRRELLTDDELGELDERDEERASSARHAEHVRALRERNASTLAKIRERNEVRLARARARRKAN